MFWMLALPVAFAGALLWLYRRPLPQLDGRLSLPGLKQPAEVIRDRWGVPHFYAASVEDVLFAQGYVHAQDRLCQVQLNRRGGHGRLAEGFGSPAFDTHRPRPLLGSRRAAPDK